LPSEFLGADNTWIGLTRRARVIMYNKDLVPEDELPTSIFDLTDPKWRGQIAAAGSTNGSMQAQIAAMRQLLGEEERLKEWLNGLIANEVTFFGGHTDVRKAVGAGEFKLGLVNHYYFHLQQAEGSNVGIIFPDQGEGQIGLITNATSAAVVKGGKNLPAAQAFLDFLVSETGQKLFAEQNYEYPLLARRGFCAKASSRWMIPPGGCGCGEGRLDFDATFDLMESVGCRNQHLSLRGLVVE
jgi:iron(III) transport system substrate-binding protein